MSDTLKKCRRGRVHDDAAALVEYLIARNGRASTTNEAIAMDLKWLVNLGGGNWKVDESRFVQARNHIKDGTADDKPCTGYRLNYRAAGRRGSEITLIDPIGDLGPHAQVAIETVRGWMSRESQHHTENHRQIETIERLGDHALALRDRIGYRLCTRMSVELDQNGTVSPTTMAEVQVWLGSLA